MEFVYIGISILIFLAQLSNGFVTAILTAIFWPFMAVYLLISIFMLDRKLNKERYEVDS